VERFVARFGKKIIGTLCGFDRLVFRGFLRRISYAAGMTLFLNLRRVLFRDFRTFVRDTTEHLVRASEAAVEKGGRPIRYLESSKTDKDAVARAIARKDGITEGLVALLKCVEPCVTCGIGPHPKTGTTQLRPKLGRCLHLYHYLFDPELGFMSARIQTWFPFHVQICINGREWLARQMDAAGLPYERQDNCFTTIADFAKAQRLMDQQLRSRWPRLLDRFARMLNPLQQEIFRDFPTSYYWTVYQSEWASDLVFESPAALREIYPALVRHASTSFSSGDVMRFLGAKVHGNFKGELLSEFGRRPEGVRVKHWVGSNSMKLYDKFGVVLRPEVTLNDPNGIKVFRPKEGDPHGEKEWRPLRKGIADLHRRAQVCQAANERYLDALAATDTSTSLGDILRQVCRPTSHNGRRIRGLRPWSADELALFQAVNRGEFAINGLRNRDLQRLLFSGPANTPSERHRRSAHVSHLLRILRAHGILHKVPKSHRYQVSPRGREILTAVLAAHDASLHKLTQLAA
jgi:hypothetical protein